MKCLCYLGILKEGFSPYSSPVMLISRKGTQYKGVVTDFRHLNVKIVKNNLAVGSALYQIQNGKPNLIVYASNRTQKSHPHTSSISLEDR